MSEAPHQRPAPRLGRAVLLGLILSVALSLITPFNDLLLGNGFIVGSYFPVGVVVPLLVLCAVINPLLWRVRPRFSFKQGELGIALGMMLICCSVMGQGLVRTWLPAMISPPYLAGQDVRFAETMQAVPTPDYLFPSSLRPESASQPLAQNFMGRLPQSEPVPWRTWILPLIAWLPFIFGSLLALMSIGLIMRRQWLEVERLPFPLAQVERSLIADPMPGRILNETLRSRAMWVTACVVAAIHGSRMASMYIPQIPVIQTWGNLGPYFNGTPLEFLPPHLTQFSIVFALTGISFFVQARVTGSIVVFVVVTALFECGYAASGKTISPDVWMYQAIGAGVAVTFFSLFMARRWLLRVVLASVGRGRDRQPSRSMTLERWGVWGLLLGLVLMLGWLCVAGAQPGVALIVVVSILFVHYVTSRVIAETGVPFYRLQAEATRLVELFPASSITPRDAFVTGTATLVGSLSSRQSSMALAQHAVLVSEGDRLSDTQLRRVGLIVWAAIFCCIAVGTAAALWISYRFDGVLALNAAEGLEDPVAMRDWPAAYIMDFTGRVWRGESGFALFNPHLQFLLGLGIAITLLILNARLTWWPLAPIGYLMCHSWYSKTAWVSLMIGMVVKTLLLRFGGAKQLEAMRPVFIGMVMGEALSLALWLVVSQLLAWFDLPFYSVNLLPR